MFSLTSTLHIVLQRCKALWTLLEAAGFVQVKARLALRAVLFTKAGLTVLYPASCTMTRKGEGNTVEYMNQYFLIWNWSKLNKKRCEKITGKKNGFDARKRLVRAVGNCSVHVSPDRGFWLGRVGVCVLLGFHKPPLLGFMSEYLPVTPFSSKGTNSRSSGDLFLLFQMHLKKWVRMGLILAFCLTPYTL